MSIYQNALDVQSASNLSGVVLQFARDMRRINEEVRAERRRHRAGEHGIPSAASMPSRSPG